MRTFLILLSLLTAHVAMAQFPFEGEISYKLSIEKKDPAFVIDSSDCMVTTMHFYFKKGSFLQIPASCDIEYEYFDEGLNRYFTKLKAQDFVGSFDYSVADSDQEPVSSYKILEHTDTILGKDCNRLILQTKSMTLTFVYCPTLLVDPLWYVRTKGQYLDYVYGLTRSLYLMEIVETSHYISKTVATSILPAPISYGFFPDLSKYTIVEM